MKLVNPVVDKFFKMDRLYERPKNIKIIYILLMQKLQQRSIRDLNLMVKGQLQIFSEALLSDLLRLSMYAR